MDEQPKPSMDYCGCDCEMCKKGDHDHCPTGLCQKQTKPDEDKAE